MATKKAQKPKGTQKQKKGASFPMCINNKEARMVCLNDSCQQYPFFCSNCEDSSCQIAHQHDDDKLVSVSFKEFSKRVLRQRKPCDSLQDAISSYRDVLERLKKNLASLQEMESSSAQIDPDDEALLQKLKKQKYKQFTGSMLDQLWKSCAEDPEKKKEQQQKAEFMKIKEQEVKGISEHFEHLNKLGVDGSGGGQQQEEKPPKQQSPQQTSNSPKPKK